MKGLGGIAIVLLLAGCSPPPEALTVKASTASVPVVSPAAHLPDSAGIWSASGILLRDQPVSAPDGRFTLLWDKGHIVLSGAAHGMLADHVMGDAPPEILWSPTGVYVAITWSDDTAVPVWSVDAYYLGSGTPRDVGIPLRSQEDAKYELGYGRPGPNYAAVAWVNNESTLLIAEEKPLLGSWMNGSYLAALSVSLPDMAIGPEIDGAKLLASHSKVLGPRLLRKLAEQK
jgi:hypothetical protein